MHRLEGRDEYLVSRWDDVVFVAQHPELFSSAGVGGEPSAADDGGEWAYSAANMASSDPPEHRAKRGLGLKIVARDRLRGYEAMMRAVADELVDTFVERGEVDFGREFATPYPIHVISAVLGLPREDMPRISREGQSQGGAGIRFAGKDEQGEQRRLATEMSEYMEAALLERVECPTGDFLSELVRAQVERDGALNLPYLTGEANLLLHGGTVTTAYMLVSAMLLLLRNPEQLERVRADRALIRPMLEEALRLEAPVQWLLRFARTDTAIGGVAIPAGAPIVILLGSGNRDEARFEDPERFWIERPQVAKDQLAFGRGNHFCLGAPLARLEGQIAFESLLTRLRNIRFAESDDDVSYLPFWNKRAPASLHLEFDRA